MCSFDSKERKLLRPKKEVQEELKDDDEAILPEAWRLRYVDEPSGSQDSSYQGKREWAAMEEPEVEESDPMVSMSRLFSWALKYSAWDHFGLEHTAGGWFDLGTLLCQDQFEHYSLNDVRHLVTASLHPTGRSRFELREDARDMHKVYFIRATSKKRRFL